MCICVFATQKTINVDYASESVKLSKDGLMEIVVDLLITNKSEEEITDLCCILPQRLQPIKYTEVPLRYIFKRFIFKKKLFEDITDDLVNQNSRYNEPGKGKTYNLLKDPIDPSKTIIEFKSSNPNYPNEDLNYTGYYYGGNKMELYKGLKKQAQNLLSRLKLSLLTISLPDPLIKNEARWFRWKFLTLTGPLQVRKRLEYHFKKYSNRLYYNYAVNGPGQTFTWILTLLDTFKSQLEVYCKKTKTDKSDLLKIHREVYKEIVGKCFSETQFKIIDWRIIFFRKKLKPFSTIQIDGDIRPTGSQPSLVFDINDNLKSEEYYEWKSGSTNISNKDEGKFTIRFLTGYESLVVRLLPYIAILLSLISIFIRFFMNK